MNSIKAPLKKVFYAIAKVAARAPFFRAFFNNVYFEFGFCKVAIPGRMTLPGKTLAELFPNINDVTLHINEIPRGDWATPINDLLHLLKVSGAIGAKNILELGSYKGWTALYLAQQNPQAKIVAADLTPTHGEAYKGRPESKQIERRVGFINSEMFAADPKGSYDLIFVDADHRYDGVRRDTEIALELVSDDGYIVWHDYANYGYFNGMCQVPEYLSELSENRSLAGIKNCAMAIYSPKWDAAS